MLTVMLAAVALLADTTPAAAAPVPTVAPATATAKAADKPGADVVCHKEKELGSNIPKKVCFSKAEYEANRTESRQSLERVQAGAPLIPHN